MRISYLMYGLDRTGGTQTFIELGKRFTERGHSVCITALDDGHAINGKPEWALDSPIEYRLVRIGGNPMKDLFDAAPDADIACASYFPTSFPVARMLGRKARSVWYHMQHYEPWFFPMSNPYSDLARASYHLPLNRISNCSWLKKEVWDRHSVDSVVCCHAIKSEAFPFRPHAQRGGPKTVLALGKTHVAWKGLKTLSDAMKLVRKVLPDTALILYGSEASPSFDGKFDYFLKPGDLALAALYQESDIVVCPSWYESFPAPPLEAMSSGTPCVTTQYGTEDYCVDGVNCSVVPPRDPEAMAREILLVLTDDATREAYVMNGLSTSEKFSWDKTAGAVESVWKEALNVV